LYSSLLFEKAYCEYRLNRTEDALATIQSVAKPDSRLQELLGQVVCTASNKALLSALQLLSLNICLFASMHLCCWLGNEKGIWPVKTFQKFVFRRPDPEWYNM